MVGIRQFSLKVLFTYLYLYAVPVINAEEKRLHCFSVSTPCKDPNSLAFLAFVCEGKQGTFLHCITYVCLIGCCFGFNRDCLLLQ